MSTTNAPEQRTIDVDVEALDTRGRTVHGYAAVYGAVSEDLGGYRERIAAGAFADVLNSDVRALLNHDPNEVLGRTKSGTLRLSDEERGLRFELDLPDSPLGENVREAVRRGDLDGASFRFVVGDEDWNDELRTVTKVAELLDITLATFAAYPAASVELRTRTRPPKEEPEVEDAVEEHEDAEERSEDPGAKAPKGGLRVADLDQLGETRTVEARFREAMLDVRKGESRALGVASTLAPGELSSFLFDRLRAGSAALASGISVVTTERDTVTYPRLTVDVTPGWYSEAATITPGDPTLDSLVATPRKCAHITVFSNEVIEDSDPPALDVVRDNLVAALGLKLDLGIFEGTGTPPEIRGLKNVAGINTVSMGTNGAQITTLDQVADAMALLEAANASGGAIVMAPRTWATLRKIKEVAGSTRPVLIDGAGSPTQGIRPSIYGIAVFISSQLSITEVQGTSGAVCSSIYVYQPDQVVLVRRKDVEVELDRSRLFNSDQSEMRGKLRADLVAPNPTAITRILGILP